MSTVLTRLLVAGILSATSAGIIGAELFWNPIDPNQQKRSIAPLTDPGNWTDATGEVRAEVLIANDILRLDGTRGGNANLSGAFENNHTCAQLIANGYTGTIEISNATNSGGPTPVALTITDLTLINVGTTIDLGPDNNPATGGRLDLGSVNRIGGGTHSFAGAVFRGSAVGEIRLIGSNTQLVLPSGDCPAVVATGPFQPIFSDGCLMRRVSCDVGGNVGLAPNRAFFDGGDPQFGVISALAADLRPGAEAGGTSALFLALRGFAQPGADFGRVAITGELTIDPAQTDVFLDLSQLARDSSGTAVGVITFASLNDGAGGLPEGLFVQDGVFEGPTGSEKAGQPSGAATWKAGRSRERGARTKRKLGDQLTARSSPGGFFDVTLIETATGIDVQVVPAGSVVVPTVSFDDDRRLCRLEGQTRTNTVRLSAATTVPVSVTLQTNGSGSSASFGTTLDGLEAGDDVTVIPATLTFAPGETVKTVTVTVIDDGFADQEQDEVLTLELVPQGGTAVLGTASSFTTDIVGQETPVDFTLDNQIGGQRTTATAGQTFAVRIFDGIPPYRVTATSNVRFVPDAVRCDQSVDTQQEDGDLDPSQFFLVSVINPGAVTDFTVTDATGQSVSPILISATEDVGSAGQSEEAIVQPAIPTIGDLTLYTAVCAGTEEGLAQLKAFLAGKDTTQVRAFAWDATAQAYVQLPQEPVGGLTPAHAIFIATRDPVTFNFSGTQSPIPFTVLLRPGFNFVGIPPLDDDGTTRVSHDLFGAGNVFRLKRLDGGELTDRGEVDAVLGTGLAGNNVAFLWNGVAYTEEPVIDSGKGYWVKNLGDESILLIRDSSGTSLAPQVKTGSTPVRKLGDPPPPPTAAAARSGGDSGGCGSGGAFAAFILAFAVLALRHWRLR